MNYFTSDIHFGQRPLWGKRSHISIEEHDEYYFDILNATKKRDLIFILGDLLFPSKDKDLIQYYLDRLKQVPARIKLVPGNHDCPEIYQTDFIEVLPPLVNYKNMWLSHCAIHPGEFRERLINVHGHNHFYDLKDPRYFNVCIDRWERLVTYDEIIKHRDEVQYIGFDHALSWFKIKEE